MQEYSNPPADTAQAQRALKVLLANERAFLDTMDKIVFQYDQETKEQIVKARNIEFLLTVVVLVVLFLEGIFIFKPVVDYTQSVVNKLLNSEKELKKTNEALLETNESLFLTREELVKTNAEKYRIQAEENQIKAAALLEGQEAERKRMSRELHDGIGQMLTGLKLQLEQFKEVPFVSLKQQQNYSDLTQLLGETIDATRMVSFSLMPTTLQDFGVAASIRLLANQLNRASGLKIDTQQVHDIRRVASQTEISLYRIAQEAFNNTLKHAQATQLSVSLTLQASNILLVIQDNGQGFEPKAKVRNQQNMTGNGLSNMRTRTELLGGKLTIKSTIGGGTIITVKIPTQEV
jgi:signal transduction histidine kinase